MFLSYPYSFASTGAPLCQPRAYKIQHITLGFSDNKHFISVISSIIFFVPISMCSSNFLNSHLKLILFTTLIVQYSVRAGTHYQNSRQMPQTKRANHNSLSSFLNLPLFNSASQQIITSVYPVNIQNPLHSYTL